MAELTITAADVRIVQMDVMLPDGPAGEALSAGEVIRYDTTTARWTPANGSGAGEARVVAVACNSANYAGDIVTPMKKGILDLGDALTSLAYDLAIYMSDEDGQMADGAGDSTVDVVVGRVVPGWGATTADKLLLVDL